MGLGPQGFFISSSWRLCPKGAWTLHRRMAGRRSEQLTVLGTQERAEPGSLSSYERSHRIRSLRTQRPLLSAGKQHGAGGGTETLPPPFFFCLKKAPERAIHPCTFFIFYRINISTESITLENIHSSTTSSAAQGGRFSTQSRAGNTTVWQMP